MATWRLFALRLPSMILIQFETCLIGDESYMIQLLKLISVLGRLRSVNQSFSSTSPCTGAPIQLRGFLFHQLLYINEKSTSEISLIQTRRMVGHGGRPVWVTRPGLPLPTRFSHLLCSLLLSPASPPSSLTLPSPPAPFIFFYPSFSNLSFFHPRHASPPPSLTLASAPAPHPA